MTTTTKLICFLAAAILMVVVGLAFLFSSGSQTPPVAFSCLGVSTSSNTTFISIGITNHSGSAIVYLVGTPVVKSNGVWRPYQFSSGRPMAILEGNSRTEVVTTPVKSEELRVPILWGFYWGTGPEGRMFFAQRPPIQAPTIRQTEWRSLERRVQGLITGREPNGMGVLYTNYLEVVRP